jgi:hypothetical protein
MRLTEHVACMRDMRNSFNMLVVIRERKRPRWRPRRRWEDNIKMGHNEIVCGDEYLILLPQDVGQWQVVVSTVMNI